PAGGGARVRAERWKVRAGQALIATLGSSLYTSPLMLEPLDETPRTRTLRRRQRLWAALLRALARAELVFDRLVWGLRRRFGRLGPLQIVTYRSFGTVDHASV